MKKRRIIRENSRLVARLRGDRMELTADIEQAMRRGYERRIAQLERRGGTDRAAFAASVAWERYGAFLQLSGRPAEARHAWHEAAMCCLNGCAYDHGTVDRPARMLRIRRQALLERIRDSLPAAGR